MRSPRTTVRLGGSLELRNLRKAVTFMVMVYYSERMQIKTSKGKRHVASESRRDKMQASFPLSSPSGVVRTELSSPATSYDNRSEVFPAGETHLSLDVQGSNRGSVR